MKIACSVLIKALLGIHVGSWSHAAACAAHVCVTRATAVHEMAQEKTKDNDMCGWIGVGVSPMTAAFAESLGMVEPYGAIFDQPEPEGPAARAHIEEGDVLTSINGAPLTRSSDFAGIISAMAPGTMVYLDTWRDGEARQVMLVLGSAPCRSKG